MLDKTGTFSSGKTVSPAQTASRKKNWGNKFLTSAFSLLPDSSQVLYAHNKDEYERKRDHNCIVSVQLSGASSQVESVLGGGWSVKW